MEAHRPSRALGRNFLRYVKEERCGMIKLWPDLNFGTSLVNTEGYRPACLKCIVPSIPSSIAPPNSNFALFFVVIG